MALNLPPWTMRYAGNLYTFWTLNAGGSAVTGFATKGPLTPPDKWVTYNPTVPDLIGLNGKLVDPFTEFPVA